MRTRARTPVRVSVGARHAFVVLLVAACGTSDTKRTQADGDTVTNTARGAADASAAPDSSAARDSTFTRPFSTRVAIFIEATADEMNAMRSRLPEDDYYVVADDLMFYRSSAYEYLEQRSVPVMRLVGRRPLTFVVDGKARAYDFGEAPTLDIVVVYEPGREPKAIAPTDLHDVAEYFAFPI